VCAFLNRRVRRLFPALAFLLVVVLCLGPSLWPSVALAASYTINLYMPFIKPAQILGHTWTLAAEWQFYVIWPFILPLLLRLGRQRAAFWLLVGCAVLTLARLPFYLSGSWPIATFSPLHDTGLLFGAAVALDPPRDTPRWLGWLGLAILAPTVLANANGPLFVDAAKIPLSEIAAALVILSPPRILAWKPLVWLGVVSYGVYLWHLPMLIVLGHLPGGVALAFVGTIVMAALSRHFVERPFLHTPVNVLEPVPASPGEGAIIEAT
jgi:peptidoglycan/LPS O-acetylase OafA/YrhL